MVEGTCGGVGIRAPRWIEQRGTLHHDALRYLLRANNHLNDRTREPVAMLALHYHPEGGTASTFPSDHLMHPFDHRSTAVSFIYECVCAEIIALSIRPGDMKVSFLSSFAYPRFGRRRPFQGGISTSLNELSSRSLDQLSSAKILRNVEKRR